MKKRTRKDGKIGLSLFPRPLAFTYVHFTLDPLVEDTLQLGVEITCASPPHSRVVCCSSCQIREVCHFASFIDISIKLLQRQSVLPENWPSVCAPSDMTLTRSRPQMLQPMAQLNPSTLFNSTALKCLASLLVPSSFRCVSPVTVVTIASELGSMFISPCPTTLAELLALEPHIQ